MKISSRPPHEASVDPLDQGTKFLAHVQSVVLAKHYRHDAVPGSIKVSVTIHQGQVVTEIGFIGRDGTVHQEYAVESIDSVLNS